MSEHPSLSGMRAMVTGGAGFIGRALVARLVAEGAHVASLDQAAVGVSGAQQEFVVDLIDASAVSQAVTAFAPTAVFHLAASRVRSSELAAFRPAIEANLLGTLSLVEAMKAKCPETRLVAVGTAEEYGCIPVPFSEDARERPISAYSFSKLAMTRMLETLVGVDGLNATVIRPSVAYGPGQAPDMFLSALVAAVVVGREMPMTAGEQKRDFVYVDDVVDALLRAAVMDTALGQVINIGSGDSLRIADLAHLVETIAGVSGIVRLGALPYRAGEQMEYSVDVSLAVELLDWTAATPLEVGLKRTIEAARGSA